MQKNLARGELRTRPIHDNRAGHSFIAHIRKLFYFITKSENSHSVPGSSKQSPIKLTKDKREFRCQFCNFLVSLSVSIVWPFVLNLNTLLHDIFAKRFFRNFGVRTFRDT